MTFDVDTPACGATYFGGYSTVLDCTRPLGHRGDHRSFGGSEWGEHGSAGSSNGDDRG